MCITENTGVKLKLRSNFELILCFKMQARPMDYAPEYLQHQSVVSFHKHWMIDPLSVYNKWFSDGDVKTQTNEHIEL